MNGTSTRTPRTLDALASAPPVNQPPPPATTVVYVHHGGLPAPHPAHYHHHHAYAPWGAPVGGSAAPHSYHYHHQHQYGPPYGDAGRASHAGPAAPPLHHPQHHFPLHAHHALPFAPAGYAAGGYGPAPAPASYPAPTWYGPPTAAGVHVHHVYASPGTAPQPDGVRPHNQQQHHQDQRHASAATAHDPSAHHNPHDLGSAGSSDDDDAPPNGGRRVDRASAPEEHKKMPKKLKQPPPGRSATQLIVNYLDNAADDVELRRIFSGAGAVESARVMYDAHTNEPLGYGFVYMQTAEDASRAVTLLNRYPLRKKRLKVSFANPKRDNAPPPTAKLQMPAVNTADVTSASASAEQSGALPTTSASNSGTAAVSGPSGSSSGPASGGPSGSSGGDGSGNGSGGSDTSSSRRQDR